ncbi:hypothetical protein [Catenibacterium faecis]|uniref:hypothetical protein n=1 Tax=Catenibacterium faecis TaxID=2764323 RepID=UPI003F800FB6
MGIIVRMRLHFNINTNDFYHYYDIDLYPADFIEYTSYDHPGMYHRIKHIQEEIITRKS